MIFSISHEPRNTSAASATAVLIATVLVANLPYLAAQPAGTTLNSRLAAKLQLDGESRPRWARFSPVNPRLVLIDLDGQGLLISLPRRTPLRIEKGLTPIGWRGETLIVRDESGGFRFLDADALTPVKSFALDPLPLPWNFGKDRRMRFQIPLPETATTGIRLMPGASVDRGVLIAIEEQAPAAVASDGTGRNIVDAGGRVVFRGNKIIYGNSLSPDGYKMLVYYGNTEYVLFNRLTKRTTRLPPAIHAWTWLPDSSTLLGEISVSGKPSREEVLSTEIYIYELAGAKLARITLPAQVRGVALKILDVSAEGHILIEAEQIVPKPAYLGLMILEILWW